jgi:hypothetical protein
LPDEFEKGAGMNRVTQLETFARAGYLARAIVYIMLGYLTLATGRSEGTSTVLDDLRALPAGDIILAFTALGLFGYAVFKLYGAAVDLQGDGNDLKGSGKRIGHAASGFTHLVLCFLALQIVFGSGDGGSSGSAGDTARATPGGFLLLIIVGAGLALAAIEQAAQAATAKFMNLLSADTPPYAEAAGRIGYAARAVVFAILAWQVLRAGFGANRGELSFEAALDTLRDTGWGFTAVAAGLLVFGIYSLIMARYRTIRNEDVLERAKAGAMRFF